jgi:hypothetical protein
MLKFKFVVHHLLLMPQLVQTLHSQRDINKELHVNRSL